MGVGSSYNPTRGFSVPSIGNTRVITSTGETPVCYESLDPDTFTMTENNRSGLFTKSEGEFAQFIRIIETFDGVKKQINIEFEETDYDEDEGDDDEDEDESSSSSSEYIPGDGEGLSSIVIDKADSSGIRNRTNLNKGLTTLDDSPNRDDNKPPSQEKKSLIHVRNKNLYEAFRVFNRLRGMDGTVMHAIKNCALQEEGANTEQVQFKHENDNRGSYTEIYGWCKANFASLLEYDELVHTCLEKCGVLLSDLNSIPEEEQEDQQQQSETEVTTKTEKGEEVPIAESFANIGLLDTNTLNSEISQILKMLEEIKKKRLQFVLNEHSRGVNKKGD